MALAAALRAAEAWTAAALDEAREAQLVPHRTIGAFEPASPCLLLVEASPAYPAYITRLALNATVVVYDASSPETFDILAAASQPPDVDAFLLAHRTPSRGKPAPFAEVFGTFTAQVKTHAQIVHYAPLLCTLGETFGLAAPLFARPLTYALIVSTSHNAPLVSELAQARAGPFCTAAAHDPFIVLLPPLAPPKYPLGGVVVRGVLIKLPETYAAAPLAWDAMTRPPFYVVTPAAMTLTGYVGAGTRHVVSTCSVPLLEDAPCVFKEHRLRRRRLLRSLDDLEAQTVAQSLLDAHPAPPSSILPCRVFVETPAAGEDSRTLDLAHLLEMPVGRVGIVERCVPGLAKARADDFRALQHWTSLRTGRRLLLRRAKAALDVERRLEAGGKPVLTSVVLCHESCAKYFFTGASPGKPALAYFAETHVCTERCKQLPL